mmetsp:Transcript_2989/g.4373  ORF Transcript_2989/g.4373 Transcript_2989/m.4373 type:complete len:479 (-) Transcript_2989:1809-3245(-)
MVSLELFNKSKPYAQRFIDFVNKSRSPFHAVDQVKKQLLDKNFIPLNEKSSWEQKVKPNNHYFFTKNQSTIVAFSVGGNYKPGNAIKIVGAHTDSPDLRLKPISKQQGHNFLQVGVQTYGGGLWHTWFDRDLTVAGRVLVKSNDKIEHKLVEISKPILRIPNLAIHLDRNVREKFTINAEKHLVPVLGSMLNKPQQEGEEKKKQEKGEPGAMMTNHHSVLIELLAKELDCQPDQIVDLELSVVDYQPSAIIGANDEFISSPRLDNLLSVHVSLEGFLDAMNTVDNDDGIRCVVYFDHEEIGSSSAQGAASVMMHDFVNRLTKVCSDKDTPVDAMNTTVEKSFIISCDMAHAIHPNYPEKHESNHSPKFHEGPVIKVNCNQRYATNMVTGYLFKEVCRGANVPFQEFVVRQDMGCGSTIGPISASKTGMRVVDIGLPQLSMHSCREFMGTVDVMYASQLFKHFYEHFGEIDEKLHVDDN